MPEHRQIACGRPPGAGQGIGEQAPADGDAGLVRDLPNQRRAGDVLDEQGRGGLGPQLRDQHREIARRGLRLGVDALGREKVEAVGVRQIAECVVGGDDGAAVRRQRGDPGAGFGVESLELGDVGLGVGVDRRGAGGHGAAHRAGDVANIDHAVRQRVPGMGVDRAVGLERGDPF